VQHEPRVRRALADAAVGDHFLVRNDTLAAVDVLQLIDALEGAVLGVDRGRPRDAGRGRDVAAALRAFLRQVFRGEQLTRILLGRADVDQGYLAEPVQNVVAVGADRLVGRALELVAGRWIARRIWTLSCP